MPRKPRFFLPDVPVHMVIRGNNRQVDFAESDDYHAYLGWLKEAADTHSCHIHAYVLMSNHIHLLVSSSDPRNLSKLPQYVGRKYVPYFNYKYGRSGTLWEGRFKASIIDSEHYLLACYRYIELNPVRANMVESPDKYLWSSYTANAYAARNGIVTPHQLYLSLGKDCKHRVINYREGFKVVLDDELIKEIRASVQTGIPLGNNRCKTEVE